MIDATCPGCGPLQAPDEWAGRVVRCERCGETYTIAGIPVSGPGKACPKCHESNPPEAAQCSACGAPLHERDLRMEGHLRAIGLWFRIGGVLMLAWLGFLTLSGYPLLRFMPSEARMFLMAYGALAFGFVLIGFFLSRFSNTARLIAGICTTLFVSIQVLQAIHAFEGRIREAGSLIAVMAAGWGIAVLWALVNARASKICRPGYAQLVSMTPQARSSMANSPFFWIPMILIASIFGLALATS
jgi:RNA polymerase subunit RPABC4/transcription elongation factor Spt4